MDSLDFMPTRVKVLWYPGGFCCPQPGDFNGQEIVISAAGGMTLADYHLDDNLERACTKRRTKMIGYDAPRIIKLIKDYFRFGFKAVWGCDTGSWKMTATGESGLRYEVSGDNCCTTHALESISRLVRETTSLPDARVFDRAEELGGTEDASVVDEVADVVTFSVACLPLGTVASLMELVAREYAADGYVWERVPPCNGLGLTCDGGGSFLLRDADLFDVLDLVEGRLADWGLTLESTSSGAMPEGLPYALPLRVAAI